MWKSGLVPRRLALLGLLAGPLILIRATLIMFDVVEPGGAIDVLVAPEFLWELSLGLSTLIKGFKMPPAAPAPSHRRPAAHDGQRHPHGGGDHRPGPRTAYDVRWPAFVGRLLQLGAEIGQPCFEVAHLPGHRVLAAVLATPANAEQPPADGLAQPPSLGSDVDDVREGDAYLPLRDPLTEPQFLDGQRQGAGAADLSAAARLQPQPANGGDASQPCPELLRELRLAAPGTPPDGDHHDDERQHDHRENGEDERDGAECGHDRTERYATSRAAPPARRGGGDGGSAVWHELAQTRCRGEDPAASGFRESGRQDLNLRPPGPQPAGPGCTEC